MPGEIRPHSLIPSALELIIKNLEAGAFADAELTALLLAEKDIPECLAIGHPDRYQAIAVQQYVQPLLACIQKKDIRGAINKANVALSALDRAESTQISRSSRL